MKEDIKPRRLINNKEPRRLIIITGPSGSGKTCLGDELEKVGGWSQPYQYTTRKPRNSKELDSYIFVNKATFRILMETDRLIENTEYNQNLYGLSRWGHGTQGKNSYCIVEPNGRKQIMESFENGLLGEYDEIDTFFIGISSETQIERLTKRGDSKEDIKRRQEDIITFYPTRGCTILDGTVSSKELATYINNL